MGLNHSKISYVSTLKMILSKRRSFNPWASLCVLRKRIIFSGFVDFCQSPEPWHLAGRTCRETEPSLWSSCYDWAIVAKATFHFSPVGKGNKQGSGLTFTLSRVLTRCSAVHNYIGQSTHRVILPSIQNMTHKLVYSKGIYITAANNISYSFKFIQLRENPAKRNRNS